MLSANGTMNHRRKNLPQIAAIVGLTLLSLTGCKYDRSFMNLDSNSGSPFFGLQLAVDSGSRPPVNPERGKDGEQPIFSGRGYPTIPDLSPAAAKSPPILLTRSSATKPNGFERTSDARALKTNVRYSLQEPTTDKSLQTQSIDLRLSAF